MSFWEDDAVQAFPGILTSEPEDDSPGLFDNWSIPSKTEPSEPFYREDAVFYATPNYNKLIVAKKKQNEDTVGWLYIPGTDIDQVVLKNPTSQTNNYYLNLNFNLQPDKNGSFCADRRAKFGEMGYRWELSRNTTIYGHSWDDDPDGDLFAQLKRYKDPEFARENPYLYFSTQGDNMVWEVFAVYDTTKELPYIDPDLSESYFFDLLDIIYDSSLYHYDVSVGGKDKILTLSTCTFSVDGHDSLPDINPYRFVVMARLVSPWETMQQKASFAINPNPISPDEAANRLQSGAIRPYAYGNDIM